MIVETERPIKSEDLEDNEVHDILSNQQARPSSSIGPNSASQSSSSSATFDPSKCQFTEEELKPVPIRNKDSFI